MFNTVTRGRLSPPHLPQPSARSVSKSEYPRSDTLRDCAQHRGMQADLTLYEMNESLLSLKAENYRFKVSDNRTASATSANHDMESLPNSAPGSLESYLDLHYRVISDNWLFLPLVNLLAQGGFATYGA